MGGNPLTGRKVWLVRHIIGEEFGDPWDWCVVVIKPHFFTDTAIIKGAMFLSDYRAHMSLQRFLAAMGFTWAEAQRKNGVLKRYKLPQTGCKETQMIVIPSHN